MIYIIMILMGAIIFLSSFPTYIRIIGECENKDEKKYWAILFGFTVFFLMGYIFQVAIEIFLIPFDYRAMMSLVYLLGAIYVFFTVNLSQKSLKTSIEQNKKYSELMKSINEINENLKQKNSEMEKIKKELEVKISELEKFQSIAVSRELHMIEMKKKIESSEKAVD